MLNRRYLRIRVLQVLYSFSQDNQKDLNIKEKEMKRSIDKIYELYIYLLLLLGELRRLAAKINEDRKKKLLPAPEDLNPNTTFENDLVLLKVNNSPSIAQQKNKMKISWTIDEDALIKSIFISISAGEEYKIYLNKHDAHSNIAFEESKDFISTIYKKYIAESEELKQHLSEKSMYWTEDCYLAHICVLKTIKNLKQDEDIELMPLFKADDDNEFMLKLFRLTILDDEKISALLKEKISNWEPERIATVDMLLMKMAITEILNFPAIPVNASLNEYIELSKTYSSPKSNTFINGILDATVKELRTQNKLVKTGRGLME